MTLYQLHTNINWHKQGLPGIFIHAMKENHMGYQVFDLNRNTMHPIVKWSNQKHFEKQIYVLFGEE